MIRFSSFEDYDDSKKSTFCTINYCLVEDLTEEGAPMEVGHEVSSASAVVAVGKMVDVTCTDGYWPKEVPDSAHFAPFDAFGEGTWWDEQTEVFQATCVPPMGFFNYSGPVCAPVQCEATDLLDGAWSASNGFTVSFGEKYVLHARSMLPLRVHVYCAHDWFHCFKGGHFACACDWNTGRSFIQVPSIHGSSIACGEPEAQ